MDANETKVVSVKYQTSWPGTDPMNAQNPSQVATRATYYSVNSVPHGIEDGNVFDGNPGNYTQTNINTEYAVPSSFSMNLSHTLSSNNDSIFISCVINCTQALTVTGPLKCHVAITENAIHFTSPPGSNGEKDFYDVMRKMLPDDQGTTLATTWTVGQSQTINFAVPLPAYIYDKSQIAVVAWIQDNSNKNVKQAAFSPPLPMALDAGVTRIYNIPVLQCSAAITPSITLKNFGTTAITAATINYKIDNGAPSTQTWTGSLAYGDTIQVTLPSITTTQGSHVFTATASSPNNGADMNTYNDSKAGLFAVSLNTVSVPLTEGFTSTTFPPANWLLYNPDGGATWSRKTGAGGFGSSTSCAKMNFFSSPGENIDDLIIAPVDLSSAITSSIAFNVAYARYNATYSDQLQLQVSTDCGTTWDTVWDKQGTVLATAPDATSSFTPTSSQWRAETVNLNSYAGQASVFIKFHAISGYGNNCYVDDINITGVAGIGENAMNNILLGIYPNPFSSSTNVQFYLIQQKKVSLSIYDLLGKQVSSVDENTYNSGWHNIIIGSDNLKQGVYYLHIMIGEQEYARKLAIVK